MCHVLSFLSRTYTRSRGHVNDAKCDHRYILYEHQYGFRKGHSANHAVITLVERVAKALDTGKIVVGVYLDIRKAFDAIDHPILLRKLYSLGIRGNLYTWIKSYLTNRSQFVMYNNSKSETKFITHGVPQGSILGPLFFIVFMNDFSRASNILFSILFADDTTVIIEGQNYNNLILTLNTELNKLDVWLQANKLTLNTDKTHYMVFHRARIKSKTEKISIRNNAKDKVKSTKFLGVIIDDKLKWTEHIQYIKNKISKSIGILIKIRPYLDKVTLRNLYFTFVYPYLIYCVEVWGNACDTHLDPIIKIQKKCVRVITFSHYPEPTESLFKDLKILAFKKLVIQRILLLMFKHNIGIVPKPIASLFTKKVKFIIIILDIVARFIQQLVNLKQHNYYRTFSYHAILIWNYLSKLICTNVTLACFKKRSLVYLQTHLISYKLFDKVLCLYILIYYINKLSKNNITWNYFLSYIDIILYLFMFFNNIYMNDYLYHNVTNRYY